jgi:hypothetical protein
LGASLQFIINIYKIFQKWQKKKRLLTQSKLKDHTMTVLFYLSFREI